jgi:hypothetical protein
MEEKLETAIKNGVEILKDFTISERVRICNKALAKIMLMK